MIERWLDALPPDLARPIRLASVPAALRALFLHLPQQVLVEAELPADPAALTLTACQLLKVASLGSQLSIARLELVAPGAPLALELSHGARRRRLGPVELAGELRAVALGALEELFDGRAFTRALEAFASRSANLSALQALTHQMLLSTDLDKAQYALLAGVTAGYGLAFNRAALFLPADGGRTLVGAKATGPFDEQDAHRIWEGIEYDNKTIEDVLASADDAEGSPFEQAVRGVELSAASAPDDEVAVALASAHPVLFRRRSPTNASLARLRPSGELVLAAIAAHGELRGLLFADNVYTRQPVTAAQLEFLGFFADQLALVWQNLSLLRRVEELARCDALTGVYNRRVLDEKVREEQSRCQRAGTTCALLVFDIDHFKEINDSRGHAAGDDVLRALGALLRQDLRDHDVVARYGGDEFAVLLPGAEEEEAVTIAIRIGRAATAQGISLSAGGAMLPGDGLDAAELVARADARLYEAKRAGKARARFRDGLEVTFR